MIKNIIKYLVFLIHIFDIIFTVIGLFFYWQVLILQFFTIVSWKINKNKCIITQIEDYLFEDTIIDFYFRLIRKTNKYVKYVVPSYQRYSVYFLFIIGFIYYTIGFIYYTIGCFY